MQFIVPSDYLHSFKERQDLILPLMVVDAVTLPSNQTWSDLTELFDLQVKQELSQMYKSL